MDGGRIVLEQVLFELRVIRMNRTRWLSARLTDLPTGYLAGYKHFVSNPASIVDT